jgi:glycosyltransferase involved in cell wall biosynthesis
MDCEFIFTVIIPHKNTPELLWRCLNSIPRRDDVQIIVIDDNSNADIVNFNLFPGLTDKNIETYFTKEGKGAGYARNTGLKYAKGKWLLFADADDFFSEKAFEYLFQEADSLYEIIYFKTESCTSDTYEPVERLDVVETNNLIDNCMHTIKSADDKLRYRHCIPVGKMIKNDLIKRHTILFDEVVAHNDVMFSIQAGHFASSVSVNNHTIYYATISKGSITNTYSLVNLTSRYLVTLRQNNFLKEHGKKQYQINIAKYFLLSRRYGIKTFLYFIVLMIRYKNNPFIEMNLWVKKYLVWRKDIKKKKKYVITN